MGAEGVVEVRQISVPDVARECAKLAPIDYEDAFRVECSRDVSSSARRWAEMVLEGAPADLRRSVLSGWRALGFALGAIPAEGFVLGWTLRRDDRDLVVLTTASPIGIAGELIFKPEPSGLLYATFVRLRGDAARRAWARIEAAHPRIVRELLADAAARIAARG